MEELSLLQPGVSGYFIKDYQPPGVDLKEFKSICHHAARQWGGTFLGTRWGDAYTAHYYCSWFQHEHDSDRWIVALLNRYYPFLAFMDLDRGNESWSKGQIPERTTISGYGFRSHNVFSNPALTVPFSYSYRLLTITELREPLQFTYTSNTGDLVLVNPHRLSPQEVDYIANRRPPRFEIVADVVYKDLD
jgi:hypothetical protein